MLRKIALVGLLFFATATVSAQTFEVDSEESTNQQSNTITLPFAGTFIGDYDEESNPGGTQTRPGLWGGSGNNPIPYSARFDIAGQTDGAISGSLQVDVDLELLAANVSNLEIDLLGGVPGELGLGITIEYSTFNTINPFSIYPGGFEIPIPLGSAQLLTSVLRSEGVSPLVLDGPVDGVYTVEGVLAGLVTAVFQFGGQEQEFISPLAMPVTGTLVEGNVGLTLSLAFTADVDEEGVIDDLPPFEDIPMPLPTLPPSDETANLLMSGSISGYHIVADQSILIVAHEVESDVPGDLDGDGLVNGADMGLLLVAWGTLDPGAADINGDGLVNGADLGLLLLAWTG
jgi:hypothetical protein